MNHTCEKCSNPRKYATRCESCYCCDDCGTRAGLITYVEGVLCLTCHDKRVEKRINEFKV